MAIRERTGARVHDRRPPSPRDANSAARDRPGNTATRRPERPQAASAEGGAWRGWGEQNWSYSAITISSGSIEHAGQFGSRWIL
jgi:hypothetical protein